MAEQEYETRPCKFGDGDVGAGERVEILDADGSKWAHPDCHTFGKAMRA